MDHVIVPGWRVMLAGRLAVPTAAVLGGSALYALNMQLTTTLMPSVIEDIGGLEFYVWSRTLLVIASVVAAANSLPLIRRHGPRTAYLLAILLFCLGTLGSALAPNMPVMLLARVVQGLGGGLFFAFSYALVRLAFPEELWPRMMALIQLMFGLVSVVAPALGGAFADWHLWRGAFLLLVPIAAVFGVLAVARLPNDHLSTSRDPRPFPIMQVAMLCIAVLSISIASLLDGPIQIGAMLLLAAVTVAAVAVLDRHLASKLLPVLSRTTGAMQASLYGLVAVICTVVSIEVYIPYFLQVIHGRTPMEAGFMVSLLSIGWALAGMASASLSHRSASIAIVAGTLIICMAFGVLSIAVPNANSLGPATVFVLSVGVAMVGIGIGVAWPHVLARILLLTPKSERDHAASSISMLQQFASAAGSASVGLVANVAGVTRLGGYVGARSSSYALLLAMLGVVAIGVVLAIVSVGWTKRKGPPRTPA